MQTDEERDMQTDEARDMQTDEARDMQTDENCNGATTRALLAPTTATANRITDCIDACSEFSS